MDARAAAAQLVYRVNGSVSGGHCRYEAGSGGGGPQAPVGQTAAKPKASSRRGAARPLADLSSPLSESGGRGRWDGGAEGMRAACARARSMTSWMPGTRAWSSALRARSCGKKGRGMGVALWRSFEGCWDMCM